MYDIIGDIHGYADPLRQLLHRLGYTQRGGVFKNSSRKVIFLGDFIDRGPAIRETLEIVRPMVEAGVALSVMGNHELNALAFHARDPVRQGEHLRPHNEKNSRQHAETMRQIPARELTSHLNWFRTLPLWLDLDGLRVVHACWDSRSAAACTGEPVTNVFLVDSCTPGGPLFKPVEKLLKGKEATLPEGVVITDKDGHQQSATRVRWFDDPRGKTFRTYSIEEIDCDAPLPEAVVEEALPYPASEKPVFVGHYWLRSERPTLFAPNVACVDWSVAKGGFLCAYRWDGEQTLDDDRFVWVG
jgi:hypothetical protein